MRTIKFRVWIYDKQVEDGYLNDEYYQFHRDNEGYYVYEDWRDAEDGRSRRCIPMQFTELYDKNGKEIYEGDVLNFGNNNHVEVKFENGAFTVFSEPLGWDFDSEDIPILTDFKYCEIIGNIYENADLLKL